MKRFEIKNITWKYNVNVLKLNLDIYGNGELLTSVYEINNDCYTMPKLNINNVEKYITNDILVSDCLTDDNNSFNIQIYSIDKPPEHLNKYIDKLIKNEDSKPRILNYYPWTLKNDKNTYILDNPDYVYNDINIKFIQLIKKSDNEIILPNKLNIDKHDIYIIGNNCGYVRIIQKPDTYGKKICHPEIFTIHYENEQYDIRDFARLDEEIYKKKIIL